MSDLNVDYLVIKPYSHHPSRIGSDLITYSNHNLEFIKDLIKEYKSKLNIILRENTFKMGLEERNYKECYASDFWTFIDARGDVYYCSNFLGKKNYVYGNIYKSNFKNIWKNRKLMKVDIRECRKMCRMDKVNIYLSSLTNQKIKHVNFI